MAGGATVTRYGLRIVRREGITLDNSPDVPAGAWLCSYDPDAAHGRGWATWTFDARHALAFTDEVSAMRCWRAQSVVRPLRDDGKPNRPLTCYSVMVEPLP